MDPIANADSYEQAVEKSKKLIGDKTGVTAIYHVGDADVVVYRDSDGFLISSSSNTKLSDMK